MEFITLFTLSSIAMGAVLLIFGFKKCIETKNVIPKRLYSTWNWILVLIGFFVISYVLSLFMFTNELLHQIFMGTVYLLGGLFVVIITVLTSKTMYALNENEEIKKLNKKLKEKKDFLDHVIESLNHPFYVIDTDTYHLKLANSAARLGKLDSAATCFALTHNRNEPCESKEHICPLEEVKKTRKPVSVEHLHYDKRGNPRNVEVHAHPIFNTEGNLVEMIEYSLDITERKKAEMETKKLNKELSQAKEDLEKLLEQKNEFIHILGHDLKNPLTAPMTLLPILEKNVDDENVKKMVHTLMHSFETIKAIIYDTLKLARLDTSDKNIMLEKTNLYDIVMKSISDNEKLIEQYHFNIDNKIPEDIIVNADKFLLGQVFNNFISNAIKYTPEDYEQRAVISTEEIDDSLVVSVQDFGRGIEKGHENILFDKFSKDSKPREGFDSTGLGLSICKGIIERHNGRIWVESDGLGKGSTFFFSLPFPHQKKIDEMQINSLLKL